MKKFVCLIAISITIMSGQSLAEEAVYFADPNLKTAVEQELGISDPTPTDMLGLTNLFVNYEGITDITGLEHAINVTSLDLARNIITDLSAISGLTNLTRLYLYDNSISNISAISELVNLTGLDMSLNNITDISAISGLTGLIWLDLKVNNINDISVVSGLENLSNVSLTSNNITGISAISGLTNLTYLSLSNNPLDTGAYCIYLPIIKRNNPGIYLNYDQNPHLLTGDFESDCDVDEDDLATFANSWLNYCGSSNWCDSWDIDKSGRVDSVDFAFFSGYWQNSCNEPEWCNGMDTNKNGSVDFTDLGFLVNNWLNSCGEPEWCGGCDLYQSGSIDFADFAVFAGQWLNSTIKLYNLDLDDDPFWTTEGQWQFGQPTGEGGTSYGNPDPNSGNTGTNVYGVNLSGDYSTDVGGPYYLTSGAFDMNGFHNVRLGFARWLNTDESAYIKSTIEVSVDGTSWTEVWNHTTMGAITDPNWQLFEYDISSIADDQETVYVRWGYEMLERAYPYSGWNIDDIKLWADP